MQPIIGKGVVTGKAAISLYTALQQAKVDPEKQERLRKALQFHSNVKLYQIKG